MSYQVREEGKTGGTIYANPDDAIEAAVNWRLETGVRCEIWIVERVIVLDMEIIGVPWLVSVRYRDVLMSIQHTLAADRRYLALTLMGELYGGECAVIFSDGAEPIL